MPMLSTKRARLAIRILILLLAAAISFFFAGGWVSDTKFIEHSMESVENNSHTVMKFSAATLSASLAISALPDDFATPLAESLADMNVYFVAILAILFLEKILIQYGIKLAFTLIIPWACIVGAAAIITNKSFLKNFAARLCAFGLVIAFVVPCSTHITNYVAADLTAYVETTISETEDSAAKLNEAMESGEDDKTIFEKLSELFQVAINGISDFLLHFQNNIRKCLNSIAILVLTNCLMPVLTFFALKWGMKETLNIALPNIPLKRRRHSEEDDEHISVGE